MSIQYVQLGDVVKLQAGIGFPLNLQGKTIGAYPFAKVGDISRCGRSGASILPSADHYVDKEDIESLRAKLVPEGSVLFAKIGEAIRQNHRVIAGCDLLIDNNAMAAIPSEKIEGRFLYHYLKTVDFYRLAPATTVPALRKSDLARLLVPLPPLSEQRRISIILDSVEALCSKRRKALFQIDRLAQSIFVEMFGDPLLNSQKLPLKKLSEVSLFENGDRSSNYPSGDDIKESGVLFLSTKNISNSRLDLSKYRSYISQEKFNSLSRGKTKKNDLLITLRGTLGSCCIFDGEHETAFINAQMMIIRPNHSIISRYLHALLTSPQFRDIFSRIGRGAAVPQLTSAQLSEITIPTPSLADQLEFSSRLQAVDALRRRQEQSCFELNTLFATLRFRAFRGKL